MCNNAGDGHLGSHHKNIALPAALFGGWKSTLPTAQDLTSLCAGEFHSLHVTSDLAPYFYFASSLPQQKQRVSRIAGEQDRGHNSLMLKNLTLTPLSGVLCREISANSKIPGNFQNRGRGAGGIDKVHIVPKWNDLAARSLGDEEYAGRTSGAVEPQDGIRSANPIPRSY